MKSKALIITSVNAVTKHLLLVVVSICILLFVCACRTAEPQVVNEDRIVEPQALTKPAMIRKHGDVTIPVDIPPIFKSDLLHWKADVTEAIDPVLLQQWAKKVLSETPPTTKKVFEKHEVAHPAFGISPGELPPGLTGIVIAANAVSRGRSVTFVWPSGRRHSGIMVGDESFIPTARGEYNFYLEWIPGVWLYYWPIIDG